MLTAWMPKQTQWTVLLCSLFWGSWVSLPRVEAHEGCAPALKKGVATSTTLDQQWRKTLKVFLRARNKAGKGVKRGSRALAALTGKEYERWKTLLPKLNKAIPHMSLRSLQHTRRVLEIEGDRDRNRFFNFPQSLSLSIIRSMVAIDLRRGAYHRPKPRIPQHTVSISQKPSIRRPISLPSTGSGGYAMGAVLPSAQSLIQGGKGAVDVSKLPTLVFTNRDLERFQTSKALIAWPMAKRKVGSGYGYRRDPFTKKLRKHSGIDIGAPHGTPVWAAADGYVWRSGWLGSCGLGLVIRHSKKMSTVYCHLSQILAPVGRHVQRGKLIGKVGSTGRSTSPHLHFGLILRGRSVDPQKYLP